MNRGRRVAAPSSGRQRQRNDPFAVEVGNKQTRQPKIKKKRKRGLAIGGVVTVVAVLAAVLVGNFFFKKPDVSDNDRPIVSENDHSGENSGETGEGGAATAPGGRKEDFYTFLLLGRDTGGGGNTDAIILVSYDVPNQQVNMMSIPRDTAVNVAWSTKKINSVYNAKESSGGGVQNLKQQVAYLTGVMPDFYVVIEWKAVGRIVEAVGGVEFDVPRNMNYDDPYQDLHIHLSKGVQKLNGQKAMEMLRYRHDNDTTVGYDDIGRMNTQKTFLKAMAKEVMKLKNMTKIGEFIDIFMENVETDLKLSDLTWFASKALGVDTDSIQSSTLPYFDIGTFRNAWYFLPDPVETLPLVNEQFNPYNRDITEDDLRVIVRRDDGSCYVTGGGTLLDSSWGKSYSGKKVSSSGGGMTTDKPTGVTAQPSKPSSSGSSSNGSVSSGSTSSGSSSNGSASSGSAGSQLSGSKTDKPSESKPDNSSSPSEVSDNSSSSSGGKPADNKPVETDEPVLPEPNEDTNQNEPAGGEAPPIFEPEPVPEPEPVSEPDPEPEPVPEPDPEPELPPEPILPLDDIISDLPA